MSTSAATGFARVTVVAPDRRVDVALPDDVALADLCPDVLLLTGTAADPARPAGWHLLRTDGTVLDGSATLAAQEVRDGTVLVLRPFAESLPPAVHDDVVDAVAAAVRRDHRLWHDGLLRAAGLSGAAVLLALLALPPWCADPVRHDTHGLPAVVAGTAGALLTALAAIRARVHRDRAGTLALGLGALPSLLVAGTGVVGPAAGDGPGRLQLLIGCVAVLIGAALLTVLSPRGDAPFVAAASAAAAGTLAVFGAVLSGATAASTAAVAVVCAVAAVAFLPALSARFARLPIGYDAAGHDVAGRAGDDLPVDQDGPAGEAGIAARARRGHELLLGLVGGCCAVIVTGCGVLGLSHSGWAHPLALATGCAALTRARLFDRTAQVGCLLAAGLAGVVLPLLGLAAGPPGPLVHHLPAGGQAAADIRLLWLVAAVGAGAALLTAIALIVPRTGLTPFWGRLLDLADAAVLLSLVPLCLAVLGVYAAARGLTSG